MHCIHCSHELEEELGRRAGRPQDQRSYRQCGADTEDEKRFSVDCPAYVDLRLIHCRVFADGFTVAGEFKSESKALAEYIKACLREEELQGMIGRTV